jgi:hypothetical protein
MSKPSAAERAYMARVAELACACRHCKSRCQELHPPRGLEFGTGMSLKASHMLVIPLCQKHHHEFHNLGRKTWEARYGTQAEMIEWVRSVLGMSAYERAVLGC